MTTFSRFGRNIKFIYLFSEIIKKKLFRNIFEFTNYLRGTNLEEPVEPTPGRPCLTI